LSGSTRMTDAIRKSFIVPMNDSRPMTASTGATRRRMIVKKIRAWPARRSSPPRRSMRDRVEEPVHEERVHPERAAQIDHDQPDLRVQPERGRCRRSRT
jgi:hypothetical protein